MGFELYTSKHLKYFNRLIGVLPQYFEKEDSNKLAIVYYALNGLSILGKLDSLISSHDRELLIEQIYRDHLIADGSGFRGSVVYKPQSSEQEGNWKDPLNLASTFFALNILFLLKDETVSSRINRSLIMKRVVRCQLSNGCFCPVLDLEDQPFGDSDLRYCLIAVSIRMMLSWDGDSVGDDHGNDIDIDNLERYVMSCVSYDGGMGGNKLQESHSGMIFCGLNTLAIIDRISNKDWSDTVEFLVNRQIAGFDELELEYEFNDDEDIGGFNGRLNKYGDTCYCFWCLGSLTLLNGDTLIDYESLLNFLLKTQSSLMGGFTKTTDLDEKPDPLHSFLGIFTLCMVNLKTQLSPDLCPVNVKYMLQSDIVNFIESTRWDN